MIKKSLLDLWGAIKYDSFIWLHGLRAADQIDTHMTGLEKRQLYELVRRHRPQVMVEIGSYLGASTCFLSQAARRHCRGSTVVAVDTWCNDTMPEGFRDTYDEFLRNTSRYSSVLSPRRSTSIDASVAFDQAIDLLFIDGDHDFNGVLSDWKCWSPYLSPGAIVVMHDSGWAEGVQQVIEENIHPLTQWEDCLPNLYWGQLRADEK